jgi:anti-anti-sigma factor
MNRAILHTKGARIYMRYEVYHSGIYRVFELSGVMIISQMEEFQVLVKGYISLGETHIAVRFNDASYLYSGAIAIFMSCFKMIKDNGGDLCLLEPKPEMEDLLRQMGIDNLVSIYNTVEDLPCDHRQIEELRTNFHY